MDKKTNNELKRMVKDLGAEEQLKRILTKRGSTVARKEDYLQSIRNRKKQMNAKSATKSATKSKKKWSTDNKREIGAMILTAGLVAATSVALLTGKRKMQGKVKYRICENDDCGADGDVINVTAKSITTLKPREWIDDIVLSAFCLLLNRGAFSGIAGKDQKHNDSVHAMNPYAYTLSDNVVPPPEGKKTLMYPVINASENHWVLIVVNTEENKLQCFDSIKGGETCSQFPSEKNICKCKKAPIQQNTYDCGVFVMINMFRLAYGIPIEIPITDEYVIFFRNEVKKAIVKHGKD